MDGEDDLSPSDSRLKDARWKNAHEVLNIADVARNCRAPRRRPSDSAVRCGLNGRGVSTGVPSMWRRHPAHWNLRGTYGGRPSHRKTGSRPIGYALESTSRRHARCGSAVGRPIVSGYDPGVDLPDFHGFFEATLGDRWHRFDASGMAPVEGFIRIASGFDAADVPFAPWIGSAMLTSKTVWAQPAR